MLDHKKYALAVHMPKLPLFALALLSGICCTLCLAYVPANNWNCLLALLACSMLLQNKNKYINLIPVILLGFACMSWHINLQLAQTMPAALEKQKVIVVGSVVSVPEIDVDNKVKFLFKIENLDHLDLRWGPGAKVQLSWDRPAFVVAAGQQLSLMVKLKRPRNFANPGSFDLEKFMFQQRIVALGYVVKSDHNQLLGVGQISQRLNLFRQKLIYNIATKLHADPYMGVVIALALGFKHFIPVEQNELFQNTGVAHLMAISGMHIGFIASIVFYATRLLWLVAPILILKLNLPMVASIAAFVVALVYALLTGMAISTQRALIMILFCLLGVVSKRKISALNRYSAALLLILVIDPFAVLSAGFWLSFLAVGSLILVYSGRPHMSRKKSIWYWCKPQLVIAVFMLPISLLIFARISVVGPVSNIIAIPWVSMVIVPLSVLGTFGTVIDPNLGLGILHCANQAFAWLVVVLEVLERIPVFKWQPPMQFFWLSIATAVLATIWLCLPRGIPGRFWAIVGIVPMLFSKSNTVPFNQALVTLLDVGQGLALVVRTQRHTLVYDTGAKMSNTFDLGARVVAPYLQNQGVGFIDKLVISHVDNDHVGGAEGLLGKISTREILLNDPKFLQAYAHTPCLAGQQWIWDGVIFTVLHPAANQYYKKRNDQSCILLIEAGSQKILLTGDIETKSERDLIARYGSKLQADLLLVPHHGSKTSSSVEFIDIVKPRYALIPVGYKNQYGHPKPEILDRYKLANVKVHSTEYDGAISFMLGDRAHNYRLVPKLYRRETYSFWLAKDP